MGEARQLVDRFWQMMESGDVSRFGEIWGEDSTFEMSGTTLRGVDAMVGLREQWWTAFPDLRHDIRDVSENGDTIAVEIFVTGTHTGTMRSPMGDIPATERHIEMASMDYIKVAGGKIVSWHAYPDMLGMLGQLGVMPAAA